MENTKIESKINCVETITTKLLNQIDEINTSKSIRDEINANKIIDGDISPPHKKVRLDDDEEEEEEKYEWVKPSPEPRGPRLTESDIEELYKKGYVPRPEKPRHEMTDEELWLTCEESRNGSVSIDIVKDTSLPVLKKYYKQLHESDGFDLDENPKIGLSSYGGLMKAQVCQKCHPEDYNKYMNLSQFAIDQTYNKDKKKDLKVLEVKSVNENGRWNFGKACLMTFTADSACEKKEKTFQAEVCTWITYDSEEKLMRDVLRCRLKLKE